MKINNPALPRCVWCMKDEQELHYHDTEWGNAVHDDAKHFEFILLDTFQAGLSWRTILHKRDNFKKSFDHFNYKKIAKYNQEKIDALLQDVGIVRNKLKVNATIKNAQLFMDIQKEFGSFDSYVWSFVNHKTINNKRKLHTDIPATSPESDALSQDLYKRGFKFVGSTILYAYMQAAGLVNDHLVSCFRYKECDY
jgi:DNA-3-methyladenine glycosylase I